MPASLFSVIDLSCLKWTPPPRRAGAGRIAHGDGARAGVPGPSAGPPQLLPPLRHGPPPRRPPRHLPPHPPQPPPPRRRRRRRRCHLAAAPLPVRARRPPRRRPAPRRRPPGAHGGPADHRQRRVPRPARLAGGARRGVRTCVVADGILPFAVDIAEELGMPAIAFRTVSASAVLAYLSVPSLIELGELPFPGRGGDDGLDERVRGVPGMESFLRRRDLPIQCRHLAATTTHGDPLLTSVVAATAHSRNARALLNTAISLEHPALTHLARHMRDVFAIGPLHAMSPAPAAATSLWRHDDGCMAWLDSQPNQSVVYVSLGSLTVISHEQFTELLSGLLAAGYPFLWVLRPDMAGNNHDDALLRQALLDVAGAGACVVPWAPQRDVLRHRAVGCFLTHSGWNSTAEGVAEGVPMVCWPFFADQQINSRLVGAVWGNRVDMKDACERGVVERSVKEAMESGEIRRSARRLAEQVKRDTGDGGSSALEFERLVGFIRELSKVDDEPLVEKCSLLLV
ncbi:Os07g0250100 [Oryza sativa Japonica Group]|uniref:Glycosyltransferase n=1 Tax=Oryza sativa subsp. japonica TaxID=39947 RepID=A0A0P0X446_ORYSJ|nr:hypothetical protein EE612_038209 [Oryza sativa]BAT00836.1 Os07g0250100 [Oryza sativa Japonica Group]